MELGTFFCCSLSEIGQNIQGRPGTTHLLGEELKMAAGLSEGDTKVIMAYEISEDDSRTAVCPSKRPREDALSGSGVGSNPSNKLQKNGVLGEQEEVQDLVPQDSRLNRHAHEVVAEENGDVGNNAVDESEPGDMDESLKGRDGRGNAGDRTGSPIPEEDDILQTGSPLDSDGSGNGEKESSSDAPLQSPGSDAASSEGPHQDSATSSSRSTSNDRRLVPISAPASVILRQQNDRELQEKIHKVETDYWAGQIPRQVYNEERFKLYTEEEAKEAGIVWPRQEVFSPAGYREDALDPAGAAWCGGPTWDDLLLEFGCPFGEDYNGGRDEEAAKERWRDKIERKFEEPEAKMAEYKRWEQIREIETQFYHDRISRNKYNKRRYALYTEEEREEKCLVWPHQACHSPAGYRDAVFEQYEGLGEPDWQDRMDFHWPFALSDSDSETEGVKNVCGLCIPLIEENKIETIKLREKRKVEGEKRAAERFLEEQKAEERSKKEEEERRKKLAEAKPYFCPNCNKRFATSTALSQHAAAKHQK